MSARVERQVDAWDRHEERAFTLLPYLLLAMSTAAAIAIDSDSQRKVIVDGIGAAAAAGWMLCVYQLHPAWRDRRAPMAAFFAVLIALAGLLVVNDPIYGFFSWTGYIWAARVLRGDWRFAGVAATALVTGTSQHGGVPSGSAGSWLGWAAIVLVNFGIASLFTWAGWIREAERHVRRRAIDELTEANAKLEASLRENAGLHAQLLVQAREAGIVDERQRMAREIHDTLAQGLVGIITQLEAADQAPHPRARRRHIDAAAQLARDSLAEARRSVQALTPTPLEQARLPEALADVALRWSTITGVMARATTTGEAKRMRPEIEVALLRTAQEALANVAKHARASQVVLTLSYMDDLVTLDVKDDGIGIGAPPSMGNGHALRPGESTRGAGGFGLTAMRQRIEGLDGTLQIESAPGEGTTVAACVPALAVRSVA
jgi:signal transduction histidine kinase